MGRGVEGFIYKGEQFLHYANLAFHETAFFSLTRNQKIILGLGALLLIDGLIINWHLTLLLLLSGLTAAYFFDLLFNITVMLYSYRTEPEIHISASQIASLTDDMCPTYTVLCPLYKEGRVVPQFIAAMQQIDYPSDKLQILLLLEEDDAETIAAVKTEGVPAHFQTIIVPHSKPKTKPKAMNYGLRYATGEYVVVYDAEDVPDPDQLKKAVLAFAQSDEKVACVQAKLNFYNPKQNLLTRIFTSEYSLWFDLILPGLQSISAPIPLGGTSNHFRASTLRKLSSWDAFNVTEDCDLGIRVAERGYRTTIVDSTTYEEANSNFFNWYKQRSRWIKGYIQTLFVHTRKPNKFIADGNIRDLLLFQIIVGGKVVSMFVNPIMWAITVCYFVFRGIAGPLIQSFFPGPILYIGVISLIGGNFLYLYCYMVGCAKRKHWDLIKYVFIVPLYWLGMSLAAIKGTYEVMIKPHYWAKTMHGLHLPGTPAAKPALALKEKPAYLT